MLLGSINLLFAVFISVQFAYLFGGERNIAAQGFTFAEYAHRGFFELNGGRFPFVLRHLARGFEDRQKNRSSNIRF